MKLMKCNRYLVSTIDTDGLVLQHQGISSQSAEYVTYVSSCIWVIVF